MTSEQLITLALALLATGAYLGLAIVRVNDRDGPVGARRLLFLDSLLVVAAIEVVADTLGHLYPVWRLVAIGAQGALMAGGFALLLTYRHQGDHR